MAAANSKGPARRSQFATLTQTKKPGVGNDDLFVAFRRAEPQVYASSKATTGKHEVPSFFDLRPPLLRMAAANSKGPARRSQFANLTQTKKPGDGDADLHVRDRRVKRQVYASNK